MSHGMERWGDKVALVTGASAGIGAAVVAELLAKGMRVVGCARRLTRIEALFARLDPTGDRTLALKVDVREEAAVLDMFAKIERRWGGVDVLVNNAGLGHNASLLDGDTAQWQEMFDVNVIALSVCSREAVKSMRQRGNEGQIIHISSMAGHRNPGGSGIYSATKYAVRSLTEGLRMELHAVGAPIRVSAISPGFVETEFAAQYHKSEAKAKETYSRYKVLDSEDIAETVVYLLSCPAHMQVHDVLIRPTAQPS